MPTISVIIPAYNVEKYLDKCMNSVLNQSFTDFEVLLIDDGAKDSTVQLCDKYAEKDTRVKTYHKKNGGLSDARNYGLERISGKYVTFIDSDDYIAALKNEITMVASLKNQSYSEVERILDQNFSKLIKK